MKELEEDIYGPIRDKELAKNLEWLDDFEGREEVPYLDSKGIWTVGLGRNLEQNPFTDEEINEWAIKHLKESRCSLFIHAPWVCEHPEEVRIVLTDMIYNMGIKGLMGFKKMLRALKDKDYLKASEELMDSKYAEDVGRRAVHHHDLLLTLVNKEEDK